MVGAPRSMMNSTNSLSYSKTLKRHRDVWERKPSVREAYQYLYGMIVENLSPLKPVVELGCGCGNLKEIIPGVLATDVVCTPWCDQLADACQLPFKDSSIGNILLVDVLHHIENPVIALKEIARVLASGGRGLIVEPYLSLWSRFIYKHFHHESFDLDVDLFVSTDQNQSRLGDYSNLGTSNILFYRELERLGQFLGDGIRVLKRHPFSFLVYPLTGGFRSFCFIPSAFVQKLSRFEDRLPKIIRERYTAMRVFLVLEKVR